MVRSFAHTVLIVFILTSFLIAQSDEKIKNNNSELTKIQQDIKKLESERSKQKEDEKKSVKILENLSHQSHLLNKVVQKYRREERQLDKKINSLSKEIKSLKSEIEILQDDYALYIRWLYMNAHDSKLSFLINSDSFHQAVVRYKYLNYITDKSEERLALLKENKKELENKTVVLKNENEKKHKIVLDKKKEQKRLVKREKEKKKLISQLKKNQTSIGEEIDKKRRYEIEIKTRIAKLIEADRKRKIKHLEGSYKGESVASTIPAFDYSNFENFSDLKGKMSWPVSTGKVVRDFGENKNQKLKTVTLNYGIDIKSNPKEKVFAVAQGIVSVIDWIPGFGSIIIVTHKGDYRTVYGHIVSILVNEGDEVNAGTQLGFVNESLEGDIMHFEIWSERNYQNPETWLVKK